MPTEEEKHKDCKNFENGHCTLKDIDVDPDGKACGSFENI